jgi:hypothetical protein
MKLRIQGNSIRLRLNRAEVAQFAERGTVEESIDFGPGGRMTYALEARPGAITAAEFHKGGIHVRVCQDAARRWAHGDETGIEHVAHGLTILIEKDFQCLHKGDEGLDAEAFPNPLAGER